MESSPSRVYPKLGTRSDLEMMLASSSISRPSAKLGAAISLLEFVASFTYTETEMKLLTADTYLAVIRNSVGSNMFRNLYAEVGGEKTDILKNGELSCAYFVSSVLYLFKLIDSVHATVSSTEKDLESSGWVEIKDPKPGAVLIWGEIDFGGGSLHRHTGFYLGDNRAISNDYKTGTPQEHDWKFNEERKLEKILWNTKLQ